MVERNEFHLNGCSATLNGSSSEPGLEDERETRTESVAEMKNKKTVKVVKREVNITRKVLRSGSVATDTENIDVAVGDLSEVDNRGDCYVDEVKEEKAHLSGCVAKVAENHGVAVGEAKLVGDLSEVDNIGGGFSVDEVKEELVEFPVTHGDDYENGSVEPHGKEAQVKRKRGRPRKLQISSQSDGHEDRVICVIEENKEVSLVADSRSQIEPHAEELKVKRKRGRPRKFPIISQSDTNCKLDDSRRTKRNCGGRAAKGAESDRGNCQMGRRKRGRPPTPKTKKKPGKADESDCKKMKRLKPCESSLKSPSSDGEVRIGEEQNDDGRQSKLQSKKKLSDRILQLLLAAGWTVEYRPRNGKSYNAAVYVNPEGKTHWSVTKAYEVYKTNLERSMKDQVDSTTVSGLGLLPEEDLHLLRRKAQKKRSDTGKPRLKLKDRETNEDMVCRKRVGEKAQKKRHNLERSLVSVRKIKRGEKHNRKRVALSARSSLSDADSNENGYILFEGKRTMLGWMIDSAIVPLNGKVQCMNTEVRVEGIITKEGIRCNCCDEVFSVLDFEIHCGGKHNQPFKSLYLEGGNSLLQCFLESWNRQSEAVLKGFHVVDFGSGDQNDDTCAICGDGGDLTCCDGCPSTFHQSCLGIKKFPSGSWFCCYCSCKFCEKVEAANHTLSPLLRCHLCEEKYHQACIKQDGTVPGESSPHSFCGNYCQELFDGLELLIGVKHSLPEGFSWTFLRRFELPREVSDSDISEKIAYNAKLAVAFSVMDECFSPLVDHWSGVNLLENIVYNFGSNFHRLNYSNFLTAVLERGDEIIGVASIRIHGNQLAEMPFIGTRYMYRRQGMCRRLMNGIESALDTLKVDKLVIPAVPELMDTWTSGFGFTPVRESARKTIKNLNLVVFPGVDMLEKSLANENGKLLLAAEMSQPVVDVEETKPEESKDEQNCETADAESPSYQVDSCLKSIDVEKEVNDTDLSLKLLSGSLEEKGEIGMGKLANKDVDFLHVVAVNNQREFYSGLGVNDDDSHADKPDTERQGSGDLKSSGGTEEEADEESDCYIIENSQPFGNGGAEKKIGNKALALKKGVASRLRVLPRLIQGSWGTSRVNKRYTGTSAVMIGSSHGRCV
ncbi:unnamed protein product [Eruca vesicaria subsp. sativa]|uniref:Uncharacterized protein n=1 Tax=Eruca vesicaria subsp. sativa TaxID=29727 RepID=A0ABC8IWS5_ERUVS|nr:unnamed protein product [Eruca vesicaria subsp. sativa]